MTIKTTTWSQINTSKANMAKKPKKNKPDLKLKNEINGFIEL